jgi:hypothetical protein
MNGGYLFENDALNFQGGCPTSELFHRVTDMLWVAGRIPLRAKTKLLHKAKDKVRCVGGKPNNTQGL